MEAAARDLERFKGFKRLKAGKRQAAALEQQRLMTRGLGGSCREGFLDGFKGFQRLKAGKRQA